MDIKNGTADNLVLYNIKMLHRYAEFFNILDLKCRAERSGAPLNAIAVDGNREFPSLQKDAAFRDFNEMFSHWHIN